LEAERVTKANPGIGPTDFTYGSSTKLLCPKCRSSYIFIWIQLNRSPSKMKGSCHTCNVWYDLGDSSLTGELVLRAEAIRRMKEILYPAQVQSTLEAFA